MDSNEFNSIIQKISTELWNACKQYDNEFDFTTLSVSEIEHGQIYIWVHGWKSNNEERTSCIDITQLVSKEDKYA